jgi:TIR domain
MALMAVDIFFSYAHEDEEFLNKIQKHLIPLYREGLIELLWHDRNIGAGTEWEKQIDTFLNKADIILLLVSPDFMASDYCYSKEMKRAIERHDHQQACVIPVILRHSQWKTSPIGKLQAVPTDGKPKKLAR